MCRVQTSSNPPFVFFQQSVLSKSIINFNLNKKYRNMFATPTHITSSYTLYVHVDSLSNAIIHIPIKMYKLKFMPVSHPHVLSSRHQPENSRKRLKIPTHIKLQEGVIECLMTLLLNYIYTIFRLNIHIFSFNCSLLHGKFYFQF